MNQQIIPRGVTWDVAVTRVTSIIPNMFEKNNKDSLVVFYDGAECMRKLEEHNIANKRPRGYSCEELGGVILSDDLFMKSHLRLSNLEPVFVSPFGSGSLRYVNLFIENDQIHATWQQSMKDFSQPLLYNRISI